MKSSVIIRSWRGSRTMKSIFSAAPAMTPSCCYVTAIQGSITRSAMPLAFGNSRYRRAALGGL
jgi:hypothetical protein